MNIQWKYIHTRASKALKLHVLKFTGNFTACACNKRSTVPSKKATN